MYQPQADRYQRMEYRRCGKSGLKLPMVSLGLWHNFGAITPFDIQQSLLRTAFDCGITHFDLANNYGPPYGEAERNFGLHMDRDWKPYRDELVISTKAGWDMWPGPYGNWGSRKYLMASLDQSLKRMHLDYVDIFYHHRFDPETPLEETMGALYDIVKSGKALYVGISSSYGPEETARASTILKEMGMHLLIHQPRYSMLARQPEINVLHKQVRQLQAKAEELEETVRAQNDELSDLFQRYEALKAWNLFQRSELREQIKHSLTFQYAVNDFFSLMFERLDTGRDFTEDETAFYHAMSNMLDGRDLNAEQMECIKQYVNASHERQVARLEPCDSSESLKRIREFESKDDEGFFKLPEIKLPEFKMPEINVQFPWDAKRKDADQE